MLVRVVKIDQDSRTARVVKASDPRPDSMIAPMDAKYIRSPQVGKSYRMNPVLDFVTKNGKSILTHGTLESNQSIEEMVKYQL